MVTSGWTYLRLRHHFLWREAPVLTAPLDVTSVLSSDGKMFSAAE